MADRVDVAEWITDWCIGVVASWLPTSLAEAREEALDRLAANLKRWHQQGGIPGTLEVHHA